MLFVAEKMSSLRRILPNVFEMPFNLSRNLPNRRQSNKESALYVLRREVSDSVQRERGDKLNTPLQINEQKGKETQRGGCWVESRGCWDVVGGGGDCARVNINRWLSNHTDAFKNRCKHKTPPALWWQVRTHSLESDERFDKSRFHKIYHESNVSILVAVERRLRGKRLQCYRRWHRFQIHKHNHKIYNLSTWKVKLCRQMELFSTTLQNSYRLVLCVTANIWEEEYPAG